MSPQAGTVALPKRFPLVQPLYTRAPDLPITKDSRLVNAYAEKDPMDGEYWVFKRLGISPAPVYPVTPGFPGGLYYYQPGNSIISVVGTGIFIQPSNIQVGTTIGGIQNWFETINSNPQTILIQNPYRSVIYTPSFQSSQVITDPNFPAFTVPGIAYLDGTVYVMDPGGTIHGSAAFNAAGAWDPLNVIQASSKADLGIYLTTQLSYVIAMKQWTTQVFYDAGNPTGSPLAPIPEGQIPFGCLHANTVQKIDEILIWVTSNQTISPQVIMMENLSPQPISTPSIDRLLDNIQLNVLVPQPVPPHGPFNTPPPPPQVDNAIFSWSMKHSGHRFYGLTSTVNNFTIVYDIDQKIWQIWTDINGNYWPFINFSYTAPTQAAAGLHLAQALQASTLSLPAPASLPGNVYGVDEDTTYPNDVGQLFPVDIYTPNFDGGTPRRKVLNMMYFYSDQTAGSVLNARYSDNDYKSWTNFRNVDLNFERPYLDQEGTFVRRAYHLRHRCNTRFRIKSSDLQLDLGTL